MLASEVYLIWLEHRNSAREKEEVLKLGVRERGDGKGVG